MSPNRQNSENFILPVKIILMVKYIFLVEIKINN